MAAPKSKKQVKKCSECGAVLELIHSCPLCGAVTGEVEMVEDVETYQSDLRRLREQLQELRHEGREAS